MCYCSFLSVNCSNYFVFFCDRVMSINFHRYFHKELLLSSWIVSICSWSIHIALELEEVMIWIVLNGLTQPLVWTCPGQDKGFNQLMSLSFLCFQVRNVPHEWFVLLWRDAIVGCFVTGTVPVIVGYIACWPIMT